MKAIIPSLLTAVFALVGAVAGATFRPAPEMPVEAAAETSESSDQGTGTDGAEATAKKGDEIETESVLDPDYYPMRFSRPFVVPVTDGWETQTIVVLQLNVELHRDADGKVPGLEQRLRDRIMAALIQMSHEGGFAGAITAPEVQAKVRELTRSAAEGLLPDLVGDVLVLEMLRREV